MSTKRNGTLKTLLKSLNSLDPLSLSNPVYVASVGCLGRWEGGKGDRPCVMSLDHIQRRCSKASGEEERILASGVWMVGTEWGVRSRPLMDE